MTKEKFFGRCIGQKVFIKSTENVPNFNMTGDLQVVDNYSKTAIVVFDYENGEWKSSDEFSISDCQIISRRINQMTEEEKEKYELIGLAWSTHDEIIGRFYQSSYLFDIGVFPDKYFDELKWVVEK